MIYSLETSQRSLQIAAVLSHLRALSLFHPLPYRGDHILMTRTAVNDFVGVILPLCHLFFFRKIILSLCYASIYLYHLGSHFHGLMIMNERKHFSSASVMLNTLISTLLQ